MSSSTSHVNIPTVLLKGLACASINPGLHSILVFDAPYQALDTIASAYTQMLEVATEKSVKRITLSVAEIDDDLWGNFIFSGDSSDYSVRWKPGLFASAAGDLHLHLIVIPDLAKLSLAAARACVMLVGSDVAHLERHGQHEVWQPQVCWLASCAKVEVGSLSPHLLERFSLRLHWQDIGQNYSAHRTDWLQKLLNDTPPAEFSHYPLSPQMKEQIRKAARYRAELTDTAIQAVIEYTSRLESASLRRAITLARLASALAQLEDMHQAKSSYVTDAARLIGLPSFDSYSKDSHPADQQPISSTSPQELEDTALQSDSEVASSSREEEFRSPFFEEKQQQVMENIYESDQPEEQDVFLAPEHPYPEDKAPVEREIASLQLPLQHYSESRSGQGIVIGIERTNTLRDLSVAGTIFAAAPFQTVRYKMLKQKYQQLIDQLKAENSDHSMLLDLLQKQQQLISGLEHPSPVAIQTNHPFLLSQTDLRRYRRGLIASQMLLILLDYTCLDSCNWRESLLPYLVRAYIERASICIVQVGISSATHELRAEQVNARNLLVPSINEALIEAPGKATPLAHGLEIVLQKLRHALQHGRSTVQHVVFVIVSDGRGNVPLEDSRAGLIAQPVFRKGVEDALKLAQELREFRDVEKVLLNPQPKQHTDLPLILAEAMGADVKDVPRLEEEM